MDGVDFSDFFFNDTATTEIYTLSLHDALPIRRSPVSTSPNGTTSTSTPATLNVCRLLPTRSKPEVSSSKPRQDGTATATSTSAVPRVGRVPAMVSARMSRAVAPTTMISTPWRSAAAVICERTSPATVILGSVEFDKSIIDSADPLGVLSLAGVAGRHEVGVHQGRRDEWRVRIVAL